VQDDDLMQLIKEHENSEKERFLGRETKEGGGVGAGDLLKHDRGAHVSFMKHTRPFRNQTFLP
jgi:hypothetical protein